MGNVCFVVFKIKFHDKTKFMVRFTCKLSIKIQPYKNQIFPMEVRKALKIKHGETYGFQVTEN